MHQPSRHAPQAGAHHLVKHGPTCQPSPEPTLQRPTLAGPARQPRAESCNSTCAENAGRGRQRGARAREGMWPPAGERQAKRKMLGPLLSAERAQIGPTWRHQGRLGTRRTEHAGGPRVLGMGPPWAAHGPAPGKLVPGETSVHPVDLGFGGSRGAGVSITGAPAAERPHPVSMRATWACSVCSRMTQFIRGTCFLQGVGALQGGAKLQVHMRGPGRVARTRQARRRETAAQTPPPEGSQVHTTAAGAPACLLLTLCVWMPAGVFSVCLRPLPAAEKWAGARSAPRRARCQSPRTQTLGGIHTPAGAVCPEPSVTAAGCPTFHMRVL